MTHQSVAARPVVVPTAAFGEFGLKKRFGITRDGELNARSPFIGNKPRAIGRHEHAHAKAMCPVSNVETTFEFLERDIRMGREFDDVVYRATQRLSTRCVVLNKRHRHQSDADDRRTPDSKREWRCATHAVCAGVTPLARFGAFLTLILCSDVLCRRVLQREQSRTRRCDDAIDVAAGGQRKSRSRG